MAAARTGADRGAVPVLSGTAISAMAIGYAGERRTVAGLIGPVPGRVTARVAVGSGRVVVVRRP